MSWTLLLNSLFISVLATLLALGFGFCVALWLSGLTGTSRRLVLAALFATLALPAFLFTSCWIHLLGQTGVWRSWVPFNIYSRAGTILILALMYWPIATLMIWAAWQNLEPSLLEEEPALTGWNLLRWLLIPHARLVLWQAGLIVFVLAMNNFSVPAILQVKVFPAEIWVQFNTTFNYQVALLLTLPLLVIPLAILYLLRRSGFAWPQFSGALPSGLIRQRLGQWPFAICAAAAIAILFLAAGLPLADLLLTRGTWLELGRAFAASSNALVNSLSYAIPTAVLAVVAALWGWRLPLAWFWWMLFILPGVVVGIALIYVFNRPATAAFYQSAALVILALSLKYMAVGWSGIGWARKSLDASHLDSARIDGASPWQTFRWVIWPQTYPQVLAFGCVIYLFCLWDVEILVLLGPPGGETLALRIFNLLHYGYNAQVNAMCLLLLLLAALPLLLCENISRLCKWLPAISRRTLGGTGLILVLLLGGCQPSGDTREIPLRSQFFDHIRVIGTRGTGAGQFSKPRSVEVDKEDNLYVADMTGRVQKFDAQGNYVSFWEMEITEKGKPKGMARDHDGNIIVVEPHYERVNHFSPTGQLVFAWGAKGTNFGQLAFPRAVAVNHRGEMYISEYALVERVQQFDAKGQKCLRSIGKPGDAPGQFNRAEGLGLDTQDNLYVADSCNHRIQVFSPEGQFLRQYGKAGNKLGELSYPYDVRVDARGYQFVCEFGNSRIQVFDPRGKPVEILGGIGYLPGQFYTPWGLAFDSHGNLYVADAGNHRVQKLIRKPGNLAMASSWTANHKQIPE